MGSTERQTISSARVHFFLVLTTVFWGGSFLFTKLGLKEVPPVLFVFSRFSLATLVMLGVSAGRLKAFDRDILRRGTIVGVLAVGVCGIYTMITHGYFGSARADVANDWYWSVP